MTAHASDLTSDNFWLFPAIAGNSVLARIRLASNELYSIHLISGAQLHSKAGVKLFQV